MSRINSPNQTFINEKNMDVSIPYNLVSLHCFTLSNSQVYLSTSVEYTSQLSPRTLPEAGYRALFRNALLRSSGRSYTQELQTSLLDYCISSDRLALSQLQQVHSANRIEELKQKHQEQNEKQMGWYNSLASQLRILEEYIDKLEDEKRELSSQLRNAADEAKAEKAEVATQLSEANKQLSLGAKAKHDAEVFLQHAQAIKSSKGSLHDSRLEKKTGTEVNYLSDALKASKAEVEKLSKALAAELKTSEGLQSSLLTTTQKNIELVRQLSEKEDRLVGLELERDMSHGLFNIPRTPHTGKKSRSMGLFGFRHRGDSPRKKDGPAETS